MNHQSREFSARAVRSPYPLEPETQSLLVGFGGDAQADRGFSPSSEDITNLAASLTVGNPQRAIPRKPVGSTESSERTQQTGTSYSSANAPCAPTSQSGHLRKRRADILRHWWMEVSACLLLFTALAAIVGTLYPHQGNPLPQWPYRVSVNTLISVYVVVLKGTIVLVTAEGLDQLKWRWVQESRPLEDLVHYDEATRGPLGALRLLWRLRLRSPLSSIGALVTLIVLAIDPFTFLLFGKTI